LVADFPPHRFAGISSRLSRAGVGVVFDIRHPMRMQVYKLKDVPNDENFFQRFKQAYSPFHK
jgi:hypothetical protein